MHSADASSQVRSMISAVLSVKVYLLRNTSFMLASRSSGSTDSSSIPRAVAMAGVVMSGVVEPQGDGIGLGKFVERRRMIHHLTVGVCGAGCRE